MKYVFKYKAKKDWFWKDLKAKGHNLDMERDCMTVYLQAGGLRTISKWSECDLKLGADWELATKEKMEEEAGREIKVKKG